MFKKQLIILLLITAAATVSIFYTHYHTSSVSLENKTCITPSGEQNNTIVVYVTGAVNKPGVITLPAGARIVDAVKQCGGLSETADPQGINLAQKIQDEMQIKVPVKTSIETNSVNSSDKNQEKVNINTADATQLSKLPGIGPAMASRIIQYRQKNGAFKTIEQLKNVHGIGTAKLTKIKDRILL
ncbi:ComEA family DNA-binding protein [Pectinatus sottacetonis]|uniref:ComEA family DNA-binding protein n=1 Tax=Pectinatus sottacetonis TaxID=1002795 RepID=UPI001E51D4DF|nr:ComEA family DNA-binding protein [Pectinatus sottacetonis]